MYILTSFTHVHAKTKKPNKKQSALNQEAAKVFCMDLTRQPSSNKLGVSYSYTYNAKTILISFFRYKEVIVKVLRDQAKNRHKFVVVKSYLQGKLTDFRCEERRRVSS